MGGFYYVNDAEGNIHECRACGRFRKDDVKPVVGDYVLFSEQRGKEYGYIDQIQPRKNELVRPAVANIDVMLLIVAASRPRTDFMLCDKLLIQARVADIQPVLCINKAEMNQRSVQEIMRQYAAFDVLAVSAAESTGLAELRDAIRGKCVCFTGQSAVGKTSLLNAIDESLRLETGGLSKKTGRGKHTTRATELLYIQELDAYVFDTPGFSMFDLSEMDVRQLGENYIEFDTHAGTCAFSSCLHDREPDCGVKQAVERGEIPQERYGRYLRIKNDLEGKKQ